MRNDTPYTGQELDNLISELVENGTLLTYGRIGLVVSDQLDEARRVVASRIPSEWFSMMIPSLIASLDDFIVLLEAGNFTSLQANQAMMDMCLLAAIKERLS